MENKQFNFVVLLLSSISMVILTSYGILSQGSILSNHILRGISGNENLSVLRPKTATGVASITEMWKEQTVRLNRIKTICERLNRTTSFTPPRSYTARLLVNDHDKVLFGFIPKVGCKTWKDVFLKARKAYGLKTFFTLQQFDDIERERRLRTYKKVLFVRDPIIRFLSAYLSKFRNLRNLQKNWEAMYGFKILKLYRSGSEMLRKKASDLSIDERPFLNVTLSEFIRFIIDLGDKIVLHQISDHWLPQHIVSHVCEIPYDFVGKYEKLEFEASFMLNWTMMASVIKFPEVHQSTAVASLAQEYSNVPLSLIEDLRKYYFLDFEIFGYDSAESVAKVTRDIFNIDILG